MLVSNIVAFGGSVAFNSDTDKLGSSLAMLCGKKGRVLLLCVAAYEVD